MSILTFKNGNFYLKQELLSLKKMRKHSCQNDEKLVTVEEKLTLALKSTDVLTHQTTLNRSANSSIIFEEITLRFAIGQ